MGIFLTAMTFFVLPFFLEIQTGISYKVRGFASPLGCLNLERFA